MKRKPNSTCAVCNKSIYRRPAQIASGNVYCSSKCCGISQRILRICPVCHNSYIGNKQTCSRKCGNATRKGSTYNGCNKSNKAHQGSLLKNKNSQQMWWKMWKMWRKNFAILQIHHKIERSQGGSNNLSNLELLCPNCHATHHLGFYLFRNKKNDRVLKPINK